MQQPQPILIGMCTSPFVRRVAIALKLYEMPFTHETWSIWRNPDEVAVYNPLKRVPALVWPDGEVLVDSHAIVDAIDDFIEDEAQLLLPRRGPQRRRGLAVIGLACGLADKAVSLLYESVLRPDAERSTDWAARCTAQMHDTLARLEQKRASDAASDFWLSDTLSHADIAVLCAWGFIQQAHPGFIAEDAYPSLRALVQRLEGLDAVRETREELKVKPGAGFGSAKG